MKSISVLAAFIISCPLAYSAVPGKTKYSGLIEKELLTKDIDAALMALKMPIGNRLQALKQQSNSLKSLKNIVKNSDLSLTVRWRAMTSLGRVYPKKSLKFLLKMSESSKWFHRNSSLIALTNSSPKLAVRVSERLLNDPSLVVRTAAVQSLAHLGAKGSREKLWVSLNAKKNFRKGKSLWVRQHIMKTLAQFSKSTDRLRFARHLNDQDAKVQLWAIDGLERVTGLKKEFHGMSFVDRRKKWLSWASQNKMRTRL